MGLERITFRDFFYVESDCHIGEYEISSRRNRCDLRPRKFYGLLILEMRFLSFIFEDGYFITKFLGMNGPIRKFLFFSEYLTCICLLSSIWYRFSLSFRWFLYFVFSFVACFPCGIFLSITPCRPSSRC